MPIPPGRISPQAAALLAYYPAADGAAGGRFNYEAPVVSATRQDSAQSRAGYTIKGDNRIEGSVSYQRGSGRSTSLFGFEDSRASSGLTTGGALTLRPARNMTLSLRYQYSRTSTEALPHFANRVNVSGDAGINGNDQDPRNWGPPGLSFASDLAGLSSGSYASTRTRTQVWAADFSRFRGPHNIGLGVEARAIRNDVIGQQDPRGTFGFTGAATGLDFADFLLGLPQTSTIGFGNPDKAVPRQVLRRLPDRRLASATVADIHVRRPVGVRDAGHRGAGTARESRCRSRVRVGGRGPGRAGTPTRSCGQTGPDCSLALASPGVRRWARS